ncbi:type II secretion system F family protein [Vulgatibacter sp.]|uniref:type II secretion system F family protein n=1 Tax=Vulgatibacter sp. TaxID=1971226 RepID=UPI0035669959
MAGPAASTTTKQAPKKQAPKLPTYKWTAKTRTGEEKAGEMEAADVDAVNARLRQMGMQPVQVKKKPVEIHIKIPGIGGPTKKDLVIFTRQFSTMIDAGLPIVQALDILANQMDNLEFRAVLKDVKERVETGSTFADSLSHHPKVFDTLYVQLVRAGELGGILDTILNRLAVYIEKAEKLKSKVKGAMVYPSIVLIVAVGCVAILLLYVTPVFEKMFKDFGGTMPGPTQIVIDMSHFLQDTILYIVGGIVVFAVALARALRTEKGKEAFDRFILQVPVIGNVLRKVAVARFTRTLGTMLSSGVPILDSLEVTARTAGNFVVEKAVRYTRDRISEGKTIAVPLAETNVFPPMVVQMIGVGEATGAMDAMLNKIADFYDEEVDAAVAALTAMIEPFLMVFLGGIVGFFLIAMYMPIFTMAEGIK